MNRSFVFVGNVQAAALAKLYWQVASHDQRTDIHHVPLHVRDTAHRQSLVDKADILIVQDDGSEDEPLLALLADRRSIAFPAIEADFLWPYADEHPLYNFTVPGVPGPYPSHLGDAVLNRCLRARLSGTDAIAHYALASRLEPARLDEMRSWRLDLQHDLDRRHGYTVTSFLADRLAHERLFRTRWHWQPVLFKMVAEQLLPRLEIDALTVKGALASAGEDSFPRDEMPVHPQVADHLGLAWAGTDARYRFGVEGSVTFAEFVERYVRYGCNHSLRIACGLASGGDTDLVLPQVEDGLRRSPDAADGWYAKGVILMRLGRPEDAMEAFDQAIAIDDTDGHYWMGRTHACLALHHVQQAIAAARRGAACMRGGGRAAMLLAEVLTGQEYQPSEQFDALSRALLFHPQDFDLLRRTAASALRAGRFDFSTQAGWKLVNMFPKEPFARNLLAESLEETGQRDRAIELLRQGLDAQIFNDQTYSLLGHFNLRNGSLAEAEKAFLAGQTVAPERQEFASCLQDVRALRASGVS